MGFTPMEGLVMATRSGSVDPGLMLWVQRHGGLSADEVEDLLEHQSGLAGLSGGSGDLREVVAAMDAETNVPVWPTTSMSTGPDQRRRHGAAMNGLDGLVFTGGAGESEPRLRMDVCQGWRSWGSS